MTRSRQLTYYAPPATEPEAPEPAARDGALWGWTLAEIDHVARRAAASNRWLVSDVTIRYEAAWDGIIDEILAAGSRPSLHDLQAAGKGAISRGLLKDFCHTYGVYERDLMMGIASAPRFAAYWHEPPSDAWDERIAERIALGQVMAAMSPRHVATLEALAAVADLRSAAEAAGASHTAFKARVAVARRAFEARWYSPETPPERKGPRSRYSPSAYNESRKAPCGTWSAYLRHRANGDECQDPDACKEASREHERAKRAAARKRRAAGAEAA